MVSKASEDLPEPDSPVNTTSLSRGISTSMFFRLCSRAPRIVIARIEEALFWRFALRISSISAFPGAYDAQRWARIAGNSGIGRRWVMLERRKNAHRFPVPSRIINGLLWRGLRDGGTWQQRGDAQTKRPALGRPFVSNLSCLRRSVLRDHRATPAVVDADGDEIDVLTDAIGAEEEAARRGEGVGLVLHEQMIVFERSRPVRGEAVFEADADRATPAGVVASRGGESATRVGERA